MSHKPSFEASIAPYKNFFIMGLCKNAGKTTTLVKILDICKNDTVAITSIGRDGERVDVTTKTSKPRIYIRKGSLFATAKNLLPFCDVTREIIHVSGIHTSLGEVILCRALSDGYIEIAGPSMNDQIMEIAKVFKQEKIDKILVDGAISRKTTASLPIFDATILAVGASFHRDMSRVVEKTGFITTLFSLPLYKPRDGFNKSFLTEKFTFLYEGEYFSYSPENMNDMMEPLHMSHVEACFIKGSFFSHYVNQLFSLGLTKITLVLTDASKIFITPKELSRLQTQEINLQIMNHIPLVAITMNPFSAYGNHFKPNSFQEALEEVTDIPIYNLYIDEEKSLHHGIMRKTEKEKIKEDGGA